MKGPRATPGERRAKCMQAVVDYLGRPDTTTVSFLAAAPNGSGLGKQTLAIRYKTVDMMLMDLVAYTEESLVSITDQIEAAGLPPNITAARVVAAVLQFAKKNPGLSRLLASDTIFLNAPRARERVDNLLNWLGTLTGDAFMDLVVGRLRRYITSGFSHDPTYDLDEVLNLLEPLW